MTPRFVRLSLVLGALAASTRLPAQTPPGSPAPAAKPADDDNMIPSYKLSGAPIDAVLDTLATLTGRTILRPSALQTAEYTIKIDRPIAKSELILALETLLKHNQIGVAPQGDRFLNVVPLAATKNEAPEMIEGSTFSQPASGKIATKIFQLDFLRVNEFMPQINNLLTLGIGGGVVILEKTNAALVTDTVSNLQRIETLLKALDHPATAGLTPKFYTLRNGAKASDLVNKMRTILQGTLQNQLGTSTTYNADDRTNQIILIADPRQYPFFDDLIAKLDIKADPNTRNEVIYIKHAAAKDVSTLLQQLVTGQSAAAQKASNQSVRPGQIVTPGQPTLVGPQPGGAAQPVAAAAGALPATGDVLGAGSNEFSSLVTVTYDERANAVVVSGTGDDLRLIKDLVEKIDVILAQVRIEVIIAEVTLTNSDKSGLTALGLTVGTDTPGGLGGDNGRGTHITNIDPLSLAGWNITGGVVNPLAFKAALGDTGSRSNVKILSAPTIVTTHNKEAEVIVGQSQPIITGSTSTPTTAGGATSTSTVTYKDIAIDLKVTPLIGDDGSIQLKIDQKVDDVVGNVTIDNNQQPIIGTRRATSFINVYDGQMVVLGGLQRTKNSNERAKLGFIWEIPIISQLLGGRTKSIERTELLLFVRPHVIKPMDGTADTTKNIEVLSNKEQVNQFLVDPSKPAKEPLIEKLK